MEEALKVSDFAKYIQNLTGLEDPSILVAIGNYFKKPAKLWFPWGGQNGKDFKEVRACWLGCNNDGFYLDSSNLLSGIVASRGVRKKIP